VGNLPNLTSPNLATIDKTFVKLGFHRLGTRLAYSLARRGKPAAKSKRDQRMSTGNTNLLLRNDTVLGVCEAIGQDFGFHPNWLRLTLASLFYFFPAAVVGSYLGLGIVVAFTRWVAPDRAEPAARHALADVHGDEEPLAIAA
jgi:phage shock protein PspC (stress-responsive transcriptional regulator)